MSRLKQLLSPLLVAGVSLASLTFYDRFVPLSWSMDHLMSDYLIWRGVLILILGCVVWAVCIVHPKRKDAFQTKRR